MVKNIILKSMKNKKQTAVDFFYWELIQRIDFTPMGGWDVINNILNQAKAMEKEQIIDANNIGYSASRRDTDETAEQYYTSTYGK